MYSFVIVYIYYPSGIVFGLYGGICEYIGEKLNSYMGMRWKRRSIRGIDIKERGAGERDLTFGLARGCWG